MIISKVETCSTFCCCCLTLCDPMDCNMPGCPVHHDLPEFAHAHVHWVSDDVFIHLICFLFFSCLQSSPASGSSSMSWLFTSSGQSTRASVSAPVFLMNIQGCFPLGLIGLIFLKSKGLSRLFSNTLVQKHQFFRAQPSSCLLEKNTAYYY